MIRKRGAVLEELLKKKYIGMRFQDPDDGMQMYVIHDIEYAVFGRPFQYACKCKKLPGDGEEFEFYYINTIFHIMIRETTQKPGVELETEAAGTADDLL